MKRFENEEMYEILQYLQESLKDENTIFFEVFNPNNVENLYSGEEIIYQNKIYKYHSLKVFCDLAEILFCKLNITNINHEFLVLELRKLNKEDSFHANKELKTEKYGEDSIFFRINKNEEPAFLTYYLNALKNIKISEKKRVLNLGINKADEFDIIRKMITKEEFEKIQFYGIDYSLSAISYSKNRFKDFNNLNFFCHDINKLNELNFPKMDCLISIGTLQSSSLNFKTLFMDIFQNYLEDEASIILGFPNCRWIDGEMIYGAKAANYSYSEQSVMFNDVIFCKKYLQQKKYRVTITGKNYIFLTATSIK